MGGMGWDDAGVWAEGEFLLGGEEKREVRV